MGLEIKQNVIQSYSVDGKIFTTIEEAEAYLNARTIKPKREAANDPLNIGLAGHIDKFLKSSEDRKQVIDYVLLALEANSKDESVKAYITSLSLACKA